MPETNAASARSTVYRNQRREEENAVDTVEKKVQEAFEPEVVEPVKVVVAKEDAERRQPPQIEESNRNNDDPD